MKRAVVALALAAALPAVSALAATRQKVAVLDVRAVQGVAAGTATILTAIIAGDTAQGGYDVLSQADIGALLGFERQKKMLGCGEDSSCLAEIGGALGAEYVLSTQVGQIGSRFHLSLQLLDARKGSVVARVSTFSETTEDALAATAERAVAQALAAARERSVASGAEKAQAARPSIVSPTPTATAIPTSPETATASPTAPVGGGSSAFHRAYVEARVGVGWSNVPMPTVSGTNVSDAPVLGFCAGVRWTPAWAFEIAGATSHDVHSSGTYSYISAGMPVVFQVEDDVRTLFLAAGAAWKPRASRFFSFAGELGMERYEAKHKEFPLAFSLAPDTFDERFDSWIPHLGAEVRFDYPLGWATVGLRAGVQLAKNGTAREMPLDPYSPTASSEPKFQWLKSGWFTTIPVAAAVRYEF